jgi:hypothetical protein
MPLSVVQVYARSAWRARAVFSGGSPSGVLPGDFTITRQDGGPTTAAVASVMVIDGTALELRLSEQLLAKIVYLLTWSATSFPFSFIRPIDLDRDIKPLGDDPDAEANGVDLAWVSGDPTPDGDLPRRSGLACVEHDLPNVAVLVPGELVQAPARGGNFNALVNSSSSDADIRRAGALLEAEFRRDDRVEDSEVDVTTTSNSGTFVGQVRTRAGQSAPVRST